MSKKPCLNQTTQLGEPDLVQALVHLLCMSSAVESYEIVRPLRMRSQRRRKAV